MIFKIIVASTLFLIIYAKCKVCPEHPLVYDELGCKPIIKGLHCPTSFTCPDFSSYNKSQCHYNGKSYKVGEKLTNVYRSCGRDCHCQNSKNVVSFICQNADCNRRPIPGCTYQSTLDGCCPAQVCGAAAKNPPKCYYNGQMYRKGIFIDTPKSCYQCICDENYDNSTSYKYNKNCLKTSCDTELYYLNSYQNGCAPVYTGPNACCPFYFRCPVDGDYIIPPTTPNTNADPTMTCKFGNLTLQRFDRLNENSECINCECRIPPILQCINSISCK